MQRIIISVVLVLLTGLYCAQLAAEDQAVKQALRSGYQLAAGDLIRVHVFGEEELSTEVRLTDAGTFSYPFLGEVNAQGMTISRLQELLTAGLKGDFLVDPEVTVSIVEYRNFFVNGEVEQPGGYPFQPGLTIRKAIALAGGFTERASRKKVLVIHDSGPTDEVVSGLSETVLPGDIITVDDSFF
ncbi:periplasmic protein involved in polysaccharide export [gamma proteobacterium HTCC5015]|nr:periplasmic protein involved in polysaccharide export [gamma proteobacterium HTCC5015]